MGDILRNFLAELKALIETYEQVAANALRTAEQTVEPAVEDVAERAEALIQEGEQALEALAQEVIPTPAVSPTDVPIDPTVLQSTNEESSVPSANDGNTPLAPAQDPEAPTSEGQEPDQTNESETPVQTEPQPPVEEAPVQPEPAPESQPVTDGNGNPINPPLPSSEEPQPETTVQDSPPVEVNTPAPEGDQPAQ